jgi:hypothetical protein
MNSTRRKTIQKASFESSFRMLVAAGFMPAFNYRQKNSLMVLGRGHKARGYEHAKHDLWLYLITTWAGLPREEGKRAW